MPQTTAIAQVDLPVDLAGTADELVRPFQHHPVAGRGADRPAGVNGEFELPVKNILIDAAESNRESHRARNHQRGAGGQLGRLLGPLDHRPLALVSFRQTYTHPVPVGRQQPQTVHPTGLGGRKALRRRPVGGARRQHRNAEGKPHPSGNPATPCHLHGQPAFQNVRNLPRRLLTWVARAGEPPGAIPHGEDICMPNSSRRTQRIACLILVLLNR